MADASSAVMAPAVRASPASPLRAGRCSDRSAELAQRRAQDRRRVGSRREV